MPNSFRSWLKFGLRWCLCLGALLALTAGVASAFTESASVGPGTLTWTVTSTSNTCGYGATYWQYSFSGFTFTVGSNAYSLGGSGVYFDSPSCSGSRSIGGCIQWPATQGTYCAG
jgi:hypothetical protein